MGEVNQAYFRTKTKQNIFYLIFWYPSLFLNILFLHLFLLHLFPPSSLPIFLPYFCFFLPSFSASSSFFYFLFFPSYYFFLFFAFFLFKSAFPWFFPFFPIFLYSVLSLFPHLSLHFDLSFLFPLPPSISFLSIPFFTSFLSSFKSVSLLLLPLMLMYLK